MRPVPVCVRSVSQKQLKIFQEDQDQETLHKCIFLSDDVRNAIAFILLCLFFNSRPPHPFPPCNV